MKASYLAILLFFPFPTFANNYYSNISQNNKCYRNVYREKYIPGTASNPGYIRQWEERVQVNCNYSGYSNSTNSGAER